MASSSKPRMIALKSGADLSAKQFTFVKLSADDTVTGAGAGNRVQGVVQNAPASGELAEVALQGGGAKLKVAATIARGDYLKSDANGAGIVALTTNEYGAMAMAAGVSGDVIPVEVVTGVLP